MYLLFSIQSNPPVNKLFVFILENKIVCYLLYIVFHQIREAKFDNGGSILSSSQFLIMPTAASKNEAHVKSGQN